MPVAALSGVPVVGGGVPRRWARRDNHPGAKSFAAPSSPPAPPAPVLGSGDDDDGDDENDDDAAERAADAAAGEGVRSGLEGLAGLVGWAGLEARRMLAELRGDRPRGSTTSLDWGESLFVVWVRAMGARDFWRTGEKVFWAPRPKDRGTPHVLHSLAAPVLSKVQRLHLGYVV